jgi:heptosyltransferase-2
MKILFITLSNIGDCILTLPVLDALRQKYPGAAISCLVPERPKGIFLGNPVIDKVFIFDKHSRLTEKLKLFFSLSREKFDIVVDLRNSLFGVFLRAKKKTSPLCFIPGRLRHMKDRHLFRAGFPKGVSEKAEKGSLFISSADEEYITAALDKGGAGDKSKLAVVSPGARSHIKRWDKQNFSRLCRRFIDAGWGVVLVGDKMDEAVCAHVRQASPGEIVDLCGRTSIGQLAALLKKAGLLVTNDSAVMHLASYLDVPVAAIFGPTDENKYGPWSRKNLVIKKEIFCRPCNKAMCRFSSMACLSCLRADEVFGQIIKFLGPGGSGSPAETGKGFRRILIMRTDRIGDVLLSTPVAKALRMKYPQAYISMVVSPYARDIVEGNPYLDEVIIYDKDAKHKSWLRSFKFSGRLKKKKFDLAVILHPTNRVHILAFLAGIPKRLGYDCKLGFLNNLARKHTKQRGLMHESEYNLDLVGTLGVEGDARDIFMPLKEESERWAAEMLNSCGIKETDKLLALNPGASCPSKIWPADRFAGVAEALSVKYGFKIVVLSGARDVQLAHEVAGKIKGGALDLSGRTSISQMASVLKRCSLFISNDSGPVHIASALGVPVISIFGRKQPGLSPRRWGPLGPKDVYLHKDAGCAQCLAHDCKKGFACLKAVTPEDVLSAAEAVLSV